MDAEREKMIHDAWRRYGGVMTLCAGNSMRVPEKEPTPPVRIDRAALPTNVTFKALEFRCETGFIHERPAWRVVCEGVTVAEGWR